MTERSEKKYKALLTMPVTPFSDIDVGPQLPLHLAFTIQRSTLILSISCGKGPHLADNRGLTLLKTWTKAGPLVSSGTISVTILTVFLIQDTIRVSSSNFQ